MALDYKILGQSVPAANTYTDLYTVPAGKQAIVSTLNVCNVSSSNVTFRVAARRSGATLTTAQFIAFDTPLQLQDSLGLTFLLAQLEINHLPTDYFLNIKQHFLPQI